MFWELWHLTTANQLDAFETEIAALSLARELLSLGRRADELTLIFDDPSVPVEELPPALTGDDLARRADAVGSQDARRTA
jgi:hypothetical protein